MLGDCGTNKAMAVAYSRKSRPPLDAQGLNELAISYVGRFATSRSKLRRYLQRKIGERGWGGAQEANLDELVGRLADLGYVDDRAYALSKARSLSARGYGEGRLKQALHGAGIREEEGAGARDLAASEAVESAIRFARRRRLGPFASEAPDPRLREKAIGAMLRAGHRLSIARAIVSLPPGAEIDEEALATAS
jgi:regulatory protein